MGLKDKKFLTLLLEFFLLTGTQCTLNAMPLL